MSGTRVVLEGPGKFDYEVPDPRAEWKRWKRGFSSWLIGAEQDGKKELVKVNLLLTLLGSQGQDIYETFEWPDENRTLAGSLERFDLHFAGLSNVTMARFRFFSFVQAGKSVTDFVTGLKSLANDCEFGVLRDSLVKDMIVINCSSEKLRERLLKECSLDLTKAVEIARIAEEAERSVEVISGSNGHGISGALAAGWRSGRKTPTENRVNKPIRFNGECFECGEYGHRAAYCPIRQNAARDRNQKRESSIRERSDERKDDWKSQAGYASFALNAVTTRGSPAGWFVDSGASQHMTPERDAFDWYEPYRNPRNVSLGDGKVVRVYGQGDVKLRVRAAGGVAIVRVGKVQFVPKLRMSLLSVTSTAKRGNEVKFHGQTCTVSCGSLRLRCAVNRCGLYEVPILDEPGGDRTGHQSTTGCAISGGVMMKSSQREGLNRATNVCACGQGWNTADSPLSYGWVPDGQRYELGGGGSPGQRIMDGGSRFQDFPKTKTGGQGYPGASTRIGTKAGGQGYPGTSTRDGMR